MITTNFNRARFSLEKFKENRDEIIRNLDYFYDYANTVFDAMKQIILTKYPYINPTLYISPETKEDDITSAMTNSGFVILYLYKILYNHDIPKVYMHEHIMHIITHELCHNVLNNNNCDQHVLESNVDRMAIYTILNNRNDIENFINIYLDFDYFIFFQDEYMFSPMQGNITFIDSETFWRNIFFYRLSFEDEQIEKLFTHDLIVLEFENIISFEYVKENGVFLEPSSEFLELINITFNFSVSAFISQSGEISDTPNSAYILFSRFNNLSPIKRIDMSQLTVPMIRIGEID